MPDPASLGATSLTSLLDAAQNGGGQSVEQMFASGVTQTSLDPANLGALTKQLAASGGSSIFDPTYLAISGILSLFGTGFLIYGKKMGEPRPLLWGLALLVLSYDYTSGVVWGIAITLAVIGFMAE